MPEPIERLRNLGPKSAQWLRAAGITTVEQLRQCGAANAYRIVKRQQPRASFNLLWALAAGIEDRDWRTLTAAEKQRLIGQFAGDD